MVNMFDKKDSNTLRESIPMDKISSLPEIMKGSVSCIEFRSHKTHFAMCLPSKAEADNVIKAFGQLMKCRMGDSLKDTPAGTVQNIITSSCLGLNVNFDIEKFGGDVNKAKAALQTAMDTALKNVAKNLKKFALEKKDSAKAVIDGKAK